MTEHIHNQQADRREIIGKRLNIVFFCVFLAMAGLILRLSVLQLRDGGSLRQQANANHVDTLTVPAARGWIYDAEGHLLASDRQSFTITYTKMSSAVQKLDNIAQVLGPVFKLTPAQVLDKMQKLPWGTAQMRLFDNATQEQVSFVSEHQSDLPGINVVVEPIRNYQLGPDGTLAAHVVGYVSSIPAPLASKYAAQKYRPDANVGLDGIELSYEQYLRGEDGALKVELNQANQTVHSFDMDPAPVRGDDLVLNIQSPLQQAMQNALKTQVDYLDQHGQPYVHNAMAVAIDPNTGAVLAMDSYPSYQPQWFVGGISSSNYEKFNTNLAATNLTTEGHYAPGSTQKPATILAALQDHNVTAGQSILDPGFYQVGNLRMNDWVPYGHGWVNAAKAIQESCDTYIYWLTLVMGHYPTNKPIDEWMKTDRVHMLKRLTYYGETLGLGVKTGVDLPDEQVGYNYDNGTLGALPLAGMGQSEQFTAMELAQYTATIANGGKRMEPHVVQKILKPDGTVLKTIDPKVLNTIPVSPDNLATVKQGMYDVCNTPEGTAYSVWLGRPYKVAGKTGTAQTQHYYGGREIEDSVFIGYAPADKPKIAIAVLVPGGGEGYMSSGPIARTVFDAFFNFKAVETPTTAPGHWG